ncbi:MAG: DoxX family protein [Acidobacteria bacterium]|nr:DoxX family protein [Acidobacteriota bacterium]
MADSKQIPLRFLAILRILVGYHFLTVGWPKLTPQFLSGERLARQFSDIAADPVGIHRVFITDVVVPNAVFFSYLVAYGEVLIGLSLLTGCLVRISSSFGAFHNLNIYLAVTYQGGGAQLAINRLYVILHLIFVVTAAGRSLGLDGWLKKRFPRAWWC